MDGYAIILHTIARSTRLAIGLTIHLILTTQWLGNMRI